MFYAVVVLELIIQTIGYLFTAVIDPLAGGLIMATVGALGISLFARLKTRRALPHRSLSDYQRVIVRRLMWGNVIVNVPFVVGVHSVGIGTIATMSALGPLCLKGRKLWENRKSRIARLQIALRGIMAVGVIVVNKPLEAFGDFHMDMLLGLACGLLSAWSYWNYLHCLFGDVIPDEERLALVAVADLRSLPIIAVTVLVGGFAIGGGYAALSPKVLLFGAIAGILAFMIPTIMAAWAGGKVPESVSGMLYLLDSPIGNVVGLLGASLGLLGREQAPDVWGWIGMVVVVGAALAAKILPFPEEPPHVGPSVKGGP
ncbi:hypothetical protein ACQPZP_33780 [Spirillospora sp. CA-142024]|uniref:hypothetical protein n=1 Tax=Spirillospora sp. CA-142024 TaxID=3240036 RepID=UPI003D8E0CD8